MLLYFFGLALAEKIVRIDRNSPFDYNFNAVHAEVPLQAPTRGLVAPGQEFQFTFECQNGISPRICAMAERGFQNAGRRIAEVLAIQQTIRIQATYGDLCPSDPSECSILGAAVAASEFPIKKNDMTVMAPQALVKQLRVENGPLPFRDIDVLATFNSRVGWYFRDDESTRGSTRYDFELVAAHEIMHGLGFSSGMIDMSSIEQLRQVTTFTDRFLTPALYFADPLRAELTTPVSTLKPINIYDFYVRSDRESYVDLAKRLSAFPKQRQPIGDFLTRFQRSGDPFQAARSIFQMASAGVGRLRFQPPQGQPIVLFSPTRYAQGSTGSHVDLAANATADFLMVPALAPGRTIEQLMQANNARSFFGPATTTIFETIGWPTRANPTIQSVTIDREFEKSSSISQTLSFSALVLSVLVLM
jgi:hypothetical protein